MQRRARRRAEVEDANSTARAWCCCVAFINVLLITAYHTDGVTVVYRAAKQVAAGGAIDVVAAWNGAASSAAPQLRGPALHRAQMGGEHHAAFDHQHSALEPHGDYGNSDGGVEAAATESHARALVPPLLLLDFTMNASVPLLYKYKPREGAASLRPNVSAATLQSVYEELYDMAKRPTDHGHRGAFLDTLGRYQPFYQGKHALVIGSLQLPVIEVATLTMGKCLSVVSVEYNPFVIQDKRLTSYSVDEYWGNGKLAKQQYDVALCYSVLQHDGLGRYGDPIDPYGDLWLMTEAWSLLRPGGLFTISVPIGNDCLVFNAYRVYGRRRLALLLRGWSIVEAIGVNPEWFEDSSCTQDHVGILVLKRTVPPNATAELLRVPGLHGDFPVHL